MNTPNWSFIKALFMQLSMAWIIPGLAVWRGQVWILTIHISIFAIYFSEAEAEMFSENYDKCMTAFVARPPGAVILDFIW